MYNIFIQTSFIYSHTRDMKKKPNLPAIIIAGAIVVVVGGIFLLASRPGQYDNLAQCLTDKGAKFYGAFWCSHCQEQKAEFGKFS